MRCDAIAVLYYAQSKQASKLSGRLSPADVKQATCLSSRDGEKQRAARQEHTRTDRIKRRCRQHIVLWPASSTESTQGPRDCQNSEDITDELRIGAFVGMDGTSTGNKKERRVGQYSKACSLLKDGDPDVIQVQLFSLRRLSSTAFAVLFRYHPPASHYCIANRQATERSTAPESQDFPFTP